MFLHKKSPAEGKVKKKKTASENVLSPELPAGPPPVPPPKPPRAHQAKNIAEQPQSPEQTGKSGKGLLDIFNTSSLDLVKSWK